MWVQIPVRLRHGVCIANAWVRIPRPKICKLACKAQGEGIFAVGEIPVKRSTKVLLFVFAARFTL